MMPSTHSPRTSDASRLLHLQDCTSVIRSAAADLDDAATGALFSVFPSVRNNATRRVASDLLRLRLAMSDVERVLRARDQDGEL